MGVLIRKCSDENCRCALYVSLMLCAYVCFWLLLLLLLFIESLKGVTSESFFFWTEENVEKKKKGSLNKRRRKHYPTRLHLRKTFMPLGQEAVQTSSLF